MDKIKSETTFFTLNGQEYEIKKVEAKIKSEIIFVKNNEQTTFLKYLNCAIIPMNISGMEGYTGPLDNHCYFYDFVMENNMNKQWEHFLVSEARKRGFVSGCSFNTGTDIIQMPSGRMKLLSLSKLATDCRHPTVIYDNGKWCEVIKKEGKQQNQNSEKCRRLITELTRQIVNDHFLILLTRKEAKEIRDILNSKL